MEENSVKNKKGWINWVLFIATIVVVFFLGLLASSVTERRVEKEFVYKPQVKISSFESRNKVWGMNFQKEYQSMIQTADTSFKSKYNGSATIDMLEVDPRLVVLWAGYGFAIDYNQGRGHHYAVDDLNKSLRTGGPTGPEDGPMPSTCWTCKSPDVPRLMEEKGISEFYTGKWSKLGHEVNNSIGCADCHDPETMNLRISRPALKEAFERQGKDIEMATHQEMRSLVCAQCHVEYYFNKDIVEGANYLTLPWDKGMSVEAMEEYYDEMNFKDWTHKLSKAPMLKAQHPGYEVYLTGVHADRGVSCADCHMAYVSEGGQKFTNHKIVSPLESPANTCQVCHREETDKLVANVYERQDKIIENRDKLEELIVRGHVEAKLAWDLGATDEQMSEILMDIRHAQWRWDYAAASHGASFHSPVEIGRVISSGITIIQEGRIKMSRLLADLGHNEAVPYPDISTKEKAQQYIGLDIEKLKAEKKIFLKDLLPKWKAQAKTREDALPIESI